MYAQKIEGDSWRGEKIDKGKIDKMSGLLIRFTAAWLGADWGPYRSAAGTAL